MKIKQEINVVWFGVLLALIAVSGPWFDLSVSNHSFVKTYIAGIGTGLLLIMALIINYKKAIITWHISYLKLFFLIVFLLGTLSIFWSVDPGLTVTKWLIWLTIFASFIASYNINPSYDNLIKFCWGLLVAVAIISVIGILQYLFDPFTLTQAAVPSSTFGNKNMATQPLTLSLPLFLFLLFSPKIKNHAVWIVTTTMSLAITFVLYTTTRGAWLSMFVEIVIIVLFLIVKRKTLKDWIDWDKNKTYATFFAVALSLLMINFSSDGWNPYWNTVTSTVQEVVDSAENDNSLRYHIWAVAREMIADSPLFGTGLGSWFHNEVQGAYGTYKVQYLQRAHNDILEMGVEIGLIGVAIFFAGVIAVLVAVWKIVVNEKPIVFWFYFLLFVALSGSFVNMQFSFPYQLAMPATLFGFFVGLIAKKSESFISPLKILNFKWQKKALLRYKQFVLGSAIIIMIIVISIYASWINAYSTLNQLNITRSFDRLYLIDTPIHHLEIPNILNFMATAYFRSKNNYQDVIKLTNKSLEYWDHDEVSLYRKGLALVNLKRFQEALLIVEEAKKYANKGSYKGYFLEMQIYRKLGNKIAYTKAFNQIVKQSENKLKLAPETYRILLVNSLLYPELYKYTEGIYQKYKKYHGYDCMNDNNIAVYYLRTKNTEKAKSIYDENKNKNCLNANLVKTLKTL